MLLINYLQKDFKDMKKVLLTLTIVAFVMAGAVSINTVTANTIDSSVFDDPPKKEKKSKKSCTDMKSGKSCCSKKAAKSCKDGDTKSTSTTKETTKESPDKK